MKKAVHPGKKALENLEVAIRAFRPSDRSQLLGLVRELEAELKEIFKDVRIKSGIGDYRTRYLKPGTKYRILVAEAGGRIIGYLMGYPSLGAPEVDNMYDILPRSSPWTPPEFYIQITFVSKPYRNRGVSKALHREIIGIARREGYREIYACIAKWNLPELAVIQSLEFVGKDLGYRYRMSFKL
jgi:GNAT superfamily N-acetyltransferase